MLDLANPPKESSRPPEYLRHKKTPYWEGVNLYSHDPDLIWQSKPQSLSWNQKADNCGLETGGTIEAAWHKTGGTSGLLLHNISFYSIIQILYDCMTQSIGLTGETLIELGSKDRCARFIILNSGLRHIQWFQAHESNPVGVQDQIAWRRLSPWASDLLIIHRLEKFRANLVRSLVRIIRSDEPQKSPVINWMTKQIPANGPSGTNTFQRRWL